MQQEDLDAARKKTDEASPDDATADDAAADGEAADTPDAAGDNKPGKKSKAALEEVGIAG